MKNHCLCNPGEINLACPVHGAKGQEAVHAMISTGGDLDNGTEERLNREIRSMVKEITHMNDLKNKYVVMLPFSDESGTELWSVWIRVGKDSICCTPTPIKEKDQAEMFREYVATLLDKIVKEMK